MKKRKLSAPIVILLGLLIGICLGSLSGKVSEGNAVSKNFKVVAYYPSWKTNQLEKLKFDTITHVNYAFAIPTKNSTLMKLENEDLAKKVIQKAHKNGAKALLSVGGWSYNGAELEPVFNEATKTKKKREKLANAIIAMCNKYGFDGVDMDWEHPRTDTTKKQYESFMVYLGKKLHGKKKLFTTAVLSGVNADGAAYYDAKAQTDKVIKAVDWLNVMAYDGGDGSLHSPYSFAKNSGKYWKNTRKVPAKKIVLGVPAYGRPMWVTYEDLIKANKAAYKKDNITYNGTKVYYNGVPTIKKKTNYAKKNLGGIMIWEVTQDTSVKSKSIVEAIGSCLK